MWPASDMFSEQSCLAVCRISWHDAHELVCGSIATPPHLQPSSQPLCVAMSMCKVVASVFVYNVAMMCSTESVAACVIVGVIKGLRSRTLMGEVLLLTGL